MDGPKREGLSDETLASEIETVLGVDPSPEFVPRIRVRIAGEGVNGAGMWSVSWRWAGAGLALAAVTTVGLWMSSNRVPAPRDAAILAPPRIEPSRRAPDVPASSLESAAPAVVPAVRKLQARPRPVQAGSEVVISQDEAAALRALFTAIATRRLEPSQLPDLAAALKPPDPIADIVLEPITIRPLATPDGE